MTSNLEPQFEGWLGHDPTSADGTMTWGPYTPKAWDETDIDIRITHCSVCSSDLSTLRSSWVCLALKLRAVLSNTLIRLTFYRHQLTTPAVLVMRLSA
jgi:hypothetical protein